MRNNFICPVNTSANLTMNEIKIGYARRLTNDAIMIYTAI